MLFSALFRKNIRSLDDLALLDLVKKNNRNATGEIFKRYAALVMGLCLKYMKDHAVAEDMMMDIFEKLPEKIKKSDIHNFRSWLHSVSRNECLMELRKSKRLTTDFEKTLTFKEDESEDSLAAAFAKNKQLDILEETLSELKSDQKMALELFYLKRKSYDEIANLLKLTTKKVKSLIQNGRRNLKLKLENKNEF